MAGTKAEERAYLLGGVNEGWHPILEAATLLLDLTAPGWKVAQVKEKFGMLRFYVDFPDPEQLYKKHDRETQTEYEERMRRVEARWDAIVELAEQASGKVCELCGEPGELRREGWLLTLCDRCLAERKGRHG